MSDLLQQLLPEDGPLWESGPRHCHVVLFYDPVEDAEAAAKFNSMPWPRSWTRILADVSVEVECAQWFGITTTPALALIEDGMILSLEHECSPGTCERALQQAAQAREDWAHPMRQC